MFARASTRLRLSVNDSRRLLDMLGPVIAREEAQRRRKRWRIAWTAALSAAALLAALGAWFGWLPP